MTTKMWLLIIWCFASSAISAFFSRPPTTNIPSFNVGFSLYTEVPNPFNVFFGLDRSAIIILSTSGKALAGHTGGYFLQPFEAHQPTNSWPLFPFRLLLHLWGLSSAPIYSSIALCTAKAKRLFSLVFTNWNIVESADLTGIFWQSSHRLNFLFLLLDH